MASSAMPANLPPHYRRLAAIVIEGLREYYYGVPAQDAKGESKGSKERDE